MQNLFRKLEILIRMNCYKYKISVIICTYNREEFLPNLIKSITQQTLDKQQYEILFINNNSTDQTETLCQQYIQQYSAWSIRYFVETQQGLSYARNRGITEAQGEYITFADDDALLAPDFLQQVCNHLDQHPDIAEVGGPIYLKYLGKIPAWENPYMNSLLGYFHPSSTSYQMKRKNKKYPRGSNMTFRTHIFSTCGHFNVALGRVKRIMLGGEEKDIAFRILDQQKKISYIPEAIVYHLVPEYRTTTSFIRTQALGTGNSEQIRSKTNQEYSKRIFIEGIKWGATFLLWIWYSITCKFSKANMLVRFRYWVTQGLLQKLPKE